MNKAYDARALVCKEDFIMKTMMLSNDDLRIKNMACLYHAITNVYGDIPVDVFISYDGDIEISPSRSYADLITKRIILVRHGEHTDTFSLYIIYDDDYDIIVYDEYNCFYGLSLLEACHLILDVKDYFDVEYGL